MEFRKVTLDEISINGGSYGIGASAVEYNQDLFTYLRITDINEDGTLDYKNLMSVNDEKADQYLLKENDICFARTGNSTGKSYFYDGQIKNMVYAGFLIKFSLDSNKVNPKYIKYYTMTKHYKNWVKEIQTGSTRGNINAKMYGKMEIILPDRIYQDKLVELLDKITTKIQLNTQTNDNLSEIIERMFINFLEKHNEELVTLEDAVKKIGTGADAIQRAPIVEYDTGIRCIRVGDMTNSRNRYEWGFTEMTEKDFDNYKLDIGDIVVTRTAVNGLSYMIEDDMKVVCNNGLIRMKVNEKYNPMFIYLYLKTKDFNEYVHRIDGETSVRPNMKVNYFTSYKIMKISKEEQDEICNRLLPLRNKQKQIIEENNTLTQLRDTLLPKLMNGEIDLDKIEI